MFFKRKLAIALAIAAMALTCIACSAAEPPAKPTSESAAASSVTSDAAATAEPAVEYSLTKDVSLASTWGTTAKFKVDESWSKGQTAEDNEDIWVHDRYADKEGNSIAVTITNVQYEEYVYLPNNTYRKWVQLEKLAFSVSAEEQAEDYKLLNEGAPDYDPEQAEPGYYTGLSNFKAEELGTKDVGGLEYRLYELSYTQTLSDSIYEKAKESNPDLQQVSDQKYFCALIKDGKHDVEISASSKQLLDDFLGTFEVIW